MKRFLSLFLVLATLLCMIPLAVSAEAVQPEAQSEATATYIDLYVKEGLVALFDGYSATASADAITSWSPVDLYGKEGYTDYLAVTAYPFHSSNGGHTWYNRDGAVAPTLNAGAKSWSYTFLNLDAIGASIGANYTVQEIYDPFAYKDAAQAVPVITDETVTNFADFKWGMNCDPNFDMYGKFAVAGYGVTLQNANGHNMLYGYIEQGLWNMAWSHNYYFCVDAYGAKQYTCSDGKTYWVEAPYAVLEKTVIRNTPVANGDGTYSCTMNVNYFGGSSLPNAVLGDEGTGAGTATEAFAFATNLRVAAGAAAMHSIRIYKGALDNAQISQNHLADLCAYYGISPEKIETILSLTARSKSHLLNDSGAIGFAYDCGIDTTEGSQYLTNKAALEAAIDAAANYVDYVSLYVADGLVALFDGYSMTASNTALKSWTPVDLTGLEYEDYLAPEAQTLYTQDKFIWQSGDGYLRLARTASGSNSAYDAYLKLGSNLSNALKNGFTVQEVFKHDSLQNPAWELALDEDTKTATSITTGGNRIGQWQNGDYGYLKVGHTFYAINKSDNYHFNYYQEAHYWGGTWKTSINFDSEYNWNGVTLGADYVSSNGTAIAWAKVGNGKLGTAERSVMYSVSEANGTYTMTAKIYHHFAPATNGTKNFSLQMTTTDAATAYQTNFTILRAAAEKNYSVRLYNKVLNSAELAQNHMADLVAFYGIDASAAKALSPIEMKLFIDSVQGIRLAHNGKDLTPGSEYMTLKAEVEALLAAAVNDFEAAYLDLYVKDGLVALFNGHEIKADDSASVHNLNKWMVDLSGVEGYDDYIDPTLYTVNAATGGNRVTYKQQDGGIGVVLAHKNDNIWSCNAAFDMSTLGALIGTTYSVQEVFSYNSMLPVVENGVITNYSALFPVSLYSAGWAFGSFTGGTSPHIGKGDGADGVNSLYMVPLDQLAFGGSYAGHWTYFGEGFNAVKYDSLKALDASGNIVLNADGSEKVWENTYVGGAVSVERTFIRLGYTSAQVEKEGVTETQYTSTYKTFFNNKPWHRPGSDAWKAPNTTINFTSADGAKHASTTLKVANMGLTRSIRVYNRELEMAEIYQNHLADLVAIYNISVETVNAIKALSDYTFAKLCEAAYAIDIAATEEQWDDAKVEIDTLVAEYLTKEEAMANSVITFGGISYRTSLDYGLRVMFAVDKDAIAYLESCGYTVEYGAIMAIKANGATEYNASASDLTVKVGEDGLIALATGNAATIVSTDAGLKHLTADNVSFAFTTIYKNDGSNADLYDATMLYRGFVVLTDAEGNSEIIYDELNVTSDPALNTPSLRALHNFVLANDPTLSEEMRKRLSFE